MGLMDSRSQVVRTHLSLPCYGRQNLAAPSMLLALVLVTMISSAFGAPSNGNRVTVQRVICAVWDTRALRMTCRMRAMDGQHCCPSQCLIERQAAEPLPLPHHLSD
jgi:hypothetical protein